MMLEIIMHFYSAFSMKISAPMGFKTLYRGLCPDCTEQFTLEGIFCRCPQYRNIWKLGQMTTPRDISSCEVHRFFYIPG